MSIAADFPDFLRPPAGLVPLARELEGSKLVGPPWSKTFVILFSYGQNCDLDTLTQEVGDPTKMGYLRVALAFLPAVHEAPAQARFQVSSWKPHTINDHREGEPAFRCSLGSEAWLTPHVPWH